MTAPQLSAHFAVRQPSVIRLAQIEFAKRGDETGDLNVAIGNVSLPMHPAMQERMRNLDSTASPFAEGVVKYSATGGLAETNAAFLNIIASSGCDTSGLASQVTDGGSQAMELVTVGCCGPAGSSDKPLLLIDAAYTNYKAFAERLGRATVSVTRTMGDDGRFTLPSVSEMEKTILEHKPGAMVVIPYDNPTGQLYDRDSLVELARLCVKHGLWLISDEAYRELYYTDAETVSVWDLTEQDVPGITGCRISIETSSKVWNACGLRIGALVTDNPDFHARSVAENTAGLCSNVIGQYIFGALADEPHADLRKWYASQREYYQGMLRGFTTRMRDLMPEVIVSRPDAGMYSVVDVRNIVPADFDALEFVLFCARTGSVQVEGRPLTLLTAPMAGFYSVAAGVTNPGRTQMRIAYVDTPERMKLVPELLKGLLEQYLKRD
jgi:aspartate aminotransferase